MIPLGCFWDCLSIQDALLNHCVNCTLNLKFWSCQPVSQLWKQLTMFLFFLPCDFLANVLFLLDTLITSSVHPLDDLSHSLCSFVWEFCNVLSLSRPLFFPHSALHLCIILCGNNSSIISLQMIHGLMVFLSQWKCSLDSLWSPPLLPSLDSLSQNRSPRVLSKRSIYLLG